jgi:hypothetical protein
MDTAAASQLLRKIKRQLSTEDVAVAAARSRHMRENMGGAVLPLRPLGAQPEKPADAPEFSGKDVAEAYLDVVADSLREHGIELEKAKVVVREAASRLEGIGQLDAFPTEESSESDGTNWVNAAQMAGFIAQAREIALTTP